MPFGNIKIYFRGSFQFSIVSILKISPPWKPEILLFSHFLKLKIAYFYGKNPFNFSQDEFHSKYFGQLWVKTIYMLIKSHFRRDSPDFQSNSLVKHLRSRSTFAMWIK